MRHPLFIICAALIAATAVSGCRNDQPTAQNETKAPTERVTSDRSNYASLPAGTTIEVDLATPISTETAHVGDAWSGTVTNGASAEGRNVIPSGSPVSGTVTAVREARKGDRAMLDLGISSISVDGRSYRVRGGMESIIAGSPRARNLGAIGAATVAGAVAGHAVGGSRKGTIIGGLIGAGAATGVVSQTKGWQVALKAGTPLTFTTNEAVAVHL